MSYIDDYIEKQKKEKEKKDPERLIYRKNEDLSSFLNKKNPSFIDSYIQRQYDIREANREEKAYMSKLTPFEQDTYKRVKANNGQPYSSPYMKRTSEGKEKLKYGNEDWNALEESERRHWLDLAEDSKSKASDSDKWKLDYARQIVGGGTGGGAIAGTLAAWNNLIDGMLHGGRNQVDVADLMDGDIYDVNTEKKWMFYSLPQNVQDELRSGSVSSDTEKYLRQYYDDDEMSMLKKYGAAITNAEKQQANREAEDENMKGAFYATAVAPAKQFASDTMLQGLAFARTLKNIAENGDQYGVLDPYETALQRQAATGSYINQSINEGLADMPVARFAYNTSMSAAESAARLAVSRGIATGITKAIPSLPFDATTGVVMNMLMAPAVMNETAVEAIQRGVPADQALTTAVAHGIFECLFETISFDKLDFFDATPIVASKGQFLKNLAKAGFVEGSEEVATDIANELWDYVNAYDFSDFKAFKDAQEAKTGRKMTDKEAWDEYKWTFAAKLGESFLGGAVSGMQMGAISNARGMKKANYYSAIGEKIDTETADRMRPVVSDAAAHNPQIRELLENAAGNETVTRGAMADVIEMMQKPYVKSIENATTSKQLDNIMENANRQLNGVISEDMFNAYNAKMVEFGKDTADYQKFLANRSKGNQTTFSDLAYGQGNSAVSEQYTKASQEMQDAMNPTIKKTMEERIASVERASEAMEKSRAMAEDIVARYGQQGKTLDSPELRKYVGILGAENAARALSIAKVAQDAEQNPVAVKSGKIYRLQTEEAVRMFGEEAARHLKAPSFNKIENTPQYTVLKAVANMTGANIAFYESDRQVIQNGAYDANTNTFYFDGNAGTSGTHAALGEVISHELTHWIRANNEEGYDRLYKFVRDDMGAEAFDSMVKQHMDKHGYDTNIASEEVVAEACQRMLASSETFMRYAAADMQGAKSLLSRLKDFIAKLRQYFRGSLNNEATRLIEDYEGLAAEWEKALNEAINAEVALDAGIDMESMEDTVLRNAIRDTLAAKDKKEGKKDGYWEAKVSSMLQEKLGVDKKTADKYIQDEQSIASLIFDNLGFLDYKPDDRYEAIKQNSDYPQGTVDLTNLCRKRAIFTQIFDSLQKHFPDRLFNAMDIAEIRQVLKDYGYEVACALCFVEDRRQRVGEIAENFIERLKLANGDGLTVINSKGEVKTLYMTKDLALTDVSKRAGFKYKDLIKVTDKYIPTQYDLVTYEGFKELSEKHPQVAAAFIRANNYLGMSSARLVEGRAEYKRQILNYTPKQVERINNKGGLRIFSFSDFEAVHLLDICQVITDASAVGLKIQAYTKVPEFAKLVANTGIKLNRSLIPFGVKGYEVLPDGTKKLKYDTKEGININHPDFFDSSDNPNIGNILVGINDEHIRLAMLDDFVDYIIPFHTNQGKSVLAVKGISAWTNYKEYQRERYIDGRKGAKDVNIYTQVIDKYNPTNKVEFVNAFLKECKAQKKIPRFDQFLNKDANGDYVYTPGYEKLLLDFKLFDKNGYILPQTTVNPSIDMDVARRILADEVKGAETREQVSKKVEETLKEKYKYSQRTDYQNLSTEYSRIVALRNGITASTDSNFSEYYNFFKKYQKGYADSSNYHSNTVGIFRKNIGGRPKGKPYYTSYTTLNGRIVRSSEYWFTPNGLVRGSDHWGKIGTCDWYYENQNSNENHGIQYGIIPWKNLLYKGIPSETYSDGFFKVSDDAYVSTYESAKFEREIQKQRADALQETTDAVGITVSMSDDERNKLLKKVVLNVAPYDVAANKIINNKNNTFGTENAKIISAILQKADKAFKISGKNYANKDFKLDFYLSRGTLERTADKRIKDDEHLVKLMPGIATAIENAVGIEIHENNYYSESKPAIYLELLGGYTDGDDFIPVRFEVKLMADGSNSISCIVNSEKVDLNKIKEDAVNVHGSSMDTQTQASSFEISLAKLFKNVNSADLLPYIPSVGLDKNQIAIKEKAIEKIQKDVDSDNDKAYFELLKKGDVKTARSMLVRAAEAHGFVVNGDYATNKDNPKIVKSMAPITYDENRKRIPISKRFELTSEEQKKVDETNGHGKKMFSAREAETIPSENSIKDGTAKYFGLTVKYVPNMEAEARNMTSEIWISDKFFDYDEKIREHILHHEVAHNLSDEMMSNHTGDWNRFASAFIQEKDVPKTSKAYENGQRTYWEGIYGDIGATALSETTTRAITEYLDEPSRLKQRSEKAYEEVKRFMDSKGINGYNNIGYENTFVEPSTGEEVRYSVREEAPPKKTLKGYKVFVVKDGKLYPPMVANPNGADTPIGIWLNADVGAQAPDSKTGRKQVKAGGKGTQGGSGSLAFRPGWHLGETPLATQFDRLNPETGKKELFPENFVWAECDIAADVDYQEEAMSYGYNKNGKFQHALAGLPKLPVNGYYKYRTNPNPETVPWLITGAMKVNRILSDAEVNQILRENGLPEKHRQGGDKNLAELGLGQHEGVRYSIRDGVANYTDERIDRLLRQYGAKNTPNYAQAYAAYISPDDFLMLTTNDLGAIERESRELNEQELRDNPQEIFLKIEEKDGKMVVYGHEGRHRMVALRNQGVSEVAISVIDLATKYTKEITDSMTLSHQIFNEQNEEDFDADIEQKATITDLVPISYENEDILKRRFGGDHQVKYSPRMSMAELDEAYENAYNEYDDDRMQELVDIAAEKAGYKYKAFHHTESDFTVFDLAKARKSMDIQAFFFSADPNAESEYGSKRYDVFLKMENPYIVDSKESAERIPFDLSKENAGVTAREWLLENGYDSVIRKADYYGAEADEYVVLNANQIKSADAMTFDENDELIPLSERFNSYNDDIRYSYRDLANSESEILVNALKNDAALVDELGAKQSIEAYAREYNRLKEMENQQIEITKQLRKKDTSPAEREVLLKKMVRLDRAILNKTTELTEMRNQRVIRDLLISEWDKRDTLVAAGRAEERYLTRKVLEEKYGKELSSLKEKSRKQKQEIRDRQEINKRKKNIEKKTKELMERILHPTEKKHIPAVLIDPIVEMLDGIDYWTPAANRRVTKKSESLRERFLNFKEAVQKYQKMNAEAEKTMSDIEVDEFFGDLFDNEFIERLDEIIAGAKNIDNVNDMSVEDIKKLDYTLTELLHLISRGNKMITSAHFASLQDAREATVEHLDTLKDVRNVKGSIFKRTNAGMADTYAFGEYAGDGTREIVDMLSKAEENKIWQVKEAVEFTQEVLAPYKKNLREWSKKQVPIELQNGKTIRMTVAQMMELYLLSKRQQARIHIFTEENGKGIHVEDRNGKRTDEVSFTYKDMDTVMEYLNANAPGAISVAEALQKFGATTITGWGNQASRLMYGFDKFTDEDYWQIRTSDSARPDTEQGEAQQNAEMYRLGGLGRTKPVNMNANNTIHIGDVFDTWSKTIDEMSSYSSILPAVTDAMRWWNSRTGDEKGTRIKQLIKDKLGTDMARVFTDSIKALNGGMSGSDSLESLVTKLTGKAKAAAVAGNIRVVLQQPTAYTRAAAVIEPKYLLKALTTTISNAKEAQEHSAIAWHKAQGFYSNGLAPSLRKLVIGDSTISESLTEKALWLAGKADDLTWGYLWNAAKLKVEAENNFEKGSERYWNAVNHIFSDIINHTQVVDTPLTKSTWMRGKGLGVFFTAFMAEPTKTYSMVMERLDKALQNPKSVASWKNFAGVAAVFGVNAMVNAMAQAIADAARDDDKEKDYWDKYVEQYFKDVKDNINPLTYVPVVKDIWSMMHGYNNSNLSMQAVQNSVYAIQEIKKISDGKSKKTLFGQAETIAKAISSWTGIPVGNVMRTLNSMGNVMGIDLFRRKKYTNSELGRNVVLSMSEGDAAQADKYMAELTENCKGDQNKADNYVIDYLAENDAEIDMWAERYMEDPTTITEAIDALSDKYSADIVTKAIRKSVNEDSEDDIKTKTLADGDALYTSDDLARCLNKGDISTAQKIIDSLDATYKEKGSKTTAKSAVTTILKPKYLAATGSEREQILKMIYKLKENGKQMYTSKEISKWK